jgi:hypothetical protein
VSPVATSLLVATALFGGNVKRKLTAGLSAIALAVGVLTTAAPANAATIKLPLADWPACSVVPTSIYCIESVVVTNGSGARRTLQYAISGQAPKAEAATNGELYAPVARIENKKVTDNSWWMPTSMREVMVNPAKQVLDLTPLFGTVNHPEQGAKYDAKTKTYDINKSLESYSYPTDCWDPATSTNVKKPFNECFKGSVAFVVDNEVKFFWFMPTAKEAADQVARIKGSTFVDLSKLAETQERPRIESTYTSSDLIVSNSWSV